MSERKSSVVQNLVVPTCLGDFSENSQTDAVINFIKILLFQRRQVRSFFDSLCIYMPVYCFEPATPPSNDTNEARKRIFICLNIYSMSDSIYCCSFDLCIYFFTCNIYCIPTYP